MTAAVRKKYKELTSEQELFLLYATPPCQGMSTNGAGTLLKGVREGNKPIIDARNRLIIPTMDIVTALRPRWFLMENVPLMRNTVINDENEITDDLVKKVYDISNIDGSLLTDYVVEELDILERELEEEEE